MIRPERADLAQSSGDSDCLTRTDRNRGKTLISLFRKGVLWIHLVAGLVSGVVIAIMAATGIAIAFKEEILEWKDREVSVIEAPAVGTAPMPIAELIDRIESAQPSLHVESLMIHRDPRKAGVLNAYHEEGPFYVDRHTGEVRNSRAKGAHEVLGKLEEWHRWLAAKEGPVSGGRLVTGVCNLALVLLCVTGLYLWFSRKWSGRALRAILLLKHGAKGKAKHFNRHNVVGFWFLPVLLVLAATAVVISFEWGHRLVFSLAGETAPESRTYGMMAVAAPAVPTPPAGARRLPLESVLERVAEQFPDWESIALEEMPHESSGPAAPLEIGVTLPDAMPSRAYIPVQADPYTGETLQAIRLQDRSPGLQARVWIRFLHTGEAFGMPGKIVATLASAAALVLVWTGFALSWRRFVPKRRASPPPPPPQGGASTGEEPP